jgi:hypothetical protein
MLYIGQSINSGPLDQTDLKEQRRCNLGGGEEPTFKGGANRAATCPSLQWFAFWSLPESAGDVFAVDNCDLI